MKNMHLDKEKLKNIITSELSNRIREDFGNTILYNFIDIHDYVTDMFEDLMFLTFEYEKLPLGSIKKDTFQNDKKYSKVLDAICLSFDHFYKVLIQSSEFIKIKAFSKKDLPKLLKDIFNSVLKEMGLTKYYVLFNKLFDIVFSICSQGKNILEDFGTEEDTFDLEKFAKVPYSHKFTSKTDDFYIFSKPYIKKILRNKNMAFESEEDVAEFLETDLPLLLSILVNIIEQNGGLEGINKEIERNKYIILPFFETFKRFFVRLFSETTNAFNRQSKEYIYSMLRNDIFSEIVYNFYDKNERAKTVVKNIFDKMKLYLEDEINNSNTNYFSRESDIKDEHFTSLSKHFFLLLTQKLWDEFYYDNKILDRGEMNLFLRRLYIIIKLVVMFVEKNLVPINYFEDFTNSEYPEETLFPIDKAKSEEAIPVENMASIITSEIVHNIFVLFRKKFGKNENKYESLYLIIKAFLRDFFVDTKYFSSFEDIFYKVDSSIKIWIKHTTGKDVPGRIGFDERAKLFLGGPLLYEAFIKRK